MKTSITGIKEAFSVLTGENPEFINPLTKSGSNRLYFRLGYKGNTVIAAYNPDRAENEAFLYITAKLNNAGVSVPEIYYDSPDRYIYLLEDLGDTDLFRLVSDGLHSGNENYKTWYKEVIRNMPAIQYKTAENFE